MALLLDKGARLEGLDDLRRTPLQLAAYDNKLRIVEMLVVAKGAGLQVDNGSGTPFL